MVCVLFESYVNYDELFECGFMPPMNKHVNSFFQVCKIVFFFFAFSLNAHLINLSILLEKHDYQLQVGKRGAFSPGRQELLAC